MGCYECVLMLVVDMFGYDLSQACVCVGNDLDSFKRIHVEDVMPTDAITMSGDHVIRL